MSHNHNGQSKIHVSKQLVDQNFSLDENSIYYFSVVWTTELCTVLLHPHYNPVVVFIDTGSVSANIQ